MLKIPTEQKIASLNAIREKHHQIKAIWFQDNISVLSILLWSIPAVLFILAISFSLEGWSNLLGFINFLGIMSTIVGACSVTPVQTDYVDDSSFYQSNWYSIISTNPLWIAIQWMMIPRA